MPDSHPAEPSWACLDFELEIGKGTGRDYPVSVIQSPEGRAQAVMHFPYGKIALERHLDSIQIALLRSGGTLRGSPLPEERATQEFGGKLFEALISSETRTCYEMSVQKAKRQGMGLRVKLRIQPPELAVLPWEFLFDARRAEYICLSRDNPIIRYIQPPEPIRPIHVALPLHILGAIASPLDLPRLDVEREMQRMEEAIKPLQEQGQVTLTWLRDPTWRDLHRAMRDGPWHIFHFIGHGGYDAAVGEGMVALLDESGAMHCLHATELGRLLADHASLRLVLLNSCNSGRGNKRDVFSSMAASLVRRGMPAVLAMQYEITDRAAIEFARAFYESLVEGLPVDVTVSEARKAVSLSVANTLEWGAPVLYMCEGAIFDMRPGPTGSPPSPKLEKLYTDGLRALQEENWDKACRCFQSVAEKDPNFLDAAAKLDQAKRLKRLGTLYVEAVAAQAAGDLALAQAKLELVMPEANNFKDTASRLAAVKWQRELAALYDEAIRLARARKYQAALAKWREVRARDPHYPDREHIEETALKGFRSRARRLRLAWSGGLFGFVAVAAIAIWLSVPRSTPGPVVMPTATATPTPTATLAPTPLSPPAVKAQPTAVTPSPAPTFAATPTPTATSAPVSTAANTPTPTTPVTVTPAVYDNFNNPAFNGRYDDGKWQISDPGSCDPNGIRQQGRVLRISGKEGQCSLSAIDYQNLSHTQTIILEARVTLVSETGSAILAVDGPRFSVACSIRWLPEKQYRFAQCYRTDRPPTSIAGLVVLSSNEPHKLSVQVDPVSMEVIGTIDDRPTILLVPTPTANDPNPNFTLRIGISSNSQNNGGTTVAEFDDVRIAAP